LKSKTQIEKVEKEFLLVRETLGKRPMETNQMMDNLIREIVSLRKTISNSNISEKSLDLLIKKFNKFS